MDEGAVEPLHVVAVREGEQHLIGQDGDGQEQDGAHRHRQGERAQPQPASRKRSQSHVRVSGQTAGERRGRPGSGNPAPACRDKGQSDAGTRAQQQTSSHITTPTQSQAEP